MHCDVNANGMRTHSEPNAIKESKVKEKKVKEDSTFEKFWNMYDKKVGDKNKVKKKWYSIGSNERLEVFVTLPAFMKQFTDKQFQPYPMTYLNQQRWKDEYIIEHIDKSEFKRDVSDSAYIGYCEKCNTSDFYKTVEEDSRCCNTKILPKRQVNVRS